MTPDTILPRLTDIFRDVFERDDLTLQPGFTAADIEGWDSFKHIEIILEVQDRFGIKVSTRDIDALRSVGDLVALIQAKRTAEPRR